MEAEQLILFQRQHESSQLQPAFGAQVGNAQQVQVGQPPAHGAYRGRGGRGRGGRGRGGRGRGRFPPNQAYGQHTGQPQGYGQQAPPYHGQQPAHPFLPAGGASTLRPQNAPSGFSSTEGILGSVPSPVVCQICFSAGHSALHCPSRFSASSAPALVAPSGESNDALWYPDSGASAHMTSSEGILSNKSPYSGTMSVSVANGIKLPIANIGDISLNTPTRPLSLKSVFHVPQIKFNLISIQKLCADNNCVAIFDKNSFFVKDKISGAVLLQARHNGHLYPVSLSPPAPLALAS
ncbi:unnamed protein product, partial [Cuscuta epithymum]